jgi:hypothetical protein
MTARRRIVACLLGSLGATTVLAASLPAQAAPPAPYLQVQVEQVKMGRNSHHYDLERRWAGAFREAKVPVYWLGTTTVTGPNEAWWFTPLQRIADLEAQEKAIAAAPGLGRASDLLSEADADNIESSRSLLARYRPDLSRPATFPVAQARYFMLVNWRIRPGQESRFEESVKLYQTASQEADPNAHWAMYQVESGMPGPAFLAIISMKSLAEMDVNEAAAKAWEKAMTPARQKQMSDLSAASTAIQSNIVVAFRPGMSHIPAEMIAQDPEYWTPRP